MRPKAKSESEREQWTEQRLTEKTEHLETFQRGPDVQSDK
jgi:hypothetical protein